MQILNFTEPLIKPALQDRSKCYTIRKAWDWNKDRFGNPTWKWTEQKECRHKVGALETIMWNQRGKNGLCGNCVFRDEKNRCIADAYARLNPEKYAIDLGDMNGCMNYDINELFPHNQSPVFSKIFGVGKILQTPKVWMRAHNYELQFKNIELSPEQIITGDGFSGTDKLDLAYRFFVDYYPIIKLEWMPFWRIRWEWQK